MNILVIHGPNLNLLGAREPGVYGTSTLAAINDAIQARASALGVDIKIVNHSSEGAIVDEIHSAIGWADGIVINPAAYTHYSIAIRDALAAVAIPAIEVHLTNIFAREEFRRVSITAGASAGLIAGLGPVAYLYALEYLVNTRGGCQSGFSRDG